MNHDLINSLDGLMSTMDGLSNVIFSGETTTPLPMAYQVSFPRLELVVDGLIEMSIGDHADSINKIQQTRSTALFVPPDGWNKPEWITPVTTLSLF
jgi:hypothetical protein